MNMQRIFSMAAGFTVMLCVGIFLMLHAAPEVKAKVQPAECPCADLVPLTDVRDVVHWQYRELACAVTRMDDGTGIMHGVCLAIETEPNALSETLTH